MKIDRNRGIAAAAALLLAGAGGAALAHPHPDGEGKKGERFVIIHDGAGGERHARGERVRRFEIVRDGKGGEHRGKGERIRRVEIIRDGEHHAGAGPRVRRFDIRGHGVLADCLDGNKVVEESAGEGDKKTKVIVCTKGGAPTAATAKHIEDALARIRTNHHLSDEQKAKIETALRSAIDRARSTR